MTINQTQDYAKMHARSIVSHPTITNYGIRRRLVAQLRTLPIYTSRSYVQNLHHVVSVPADKHKM